MAPATGEANKKPAGNAAAASGTNATPPAAGTSPAAVSGSSTTTTTTTTMPVANASGASGGAASATPSAAGSGAAGSAGAPRTGAAGEQSPPAACNPADKTAEAKVIPPMNLGDDNNNPVAPAKGPYKPIIESDPGLPTHTIFRPETLGDIPHPIVAWANGGCSKNGTWFGRFLLEFASHGFVIVADGMPMGTGTGPLTTEAGPQRAALDWIIKENDRPCSKYYRKLAVDKAAAMGQSCGGLMTLGVSSDPRLTTVVIWNSGLLQADQKIIDGIHTPIAYFIGGPDDVAYQQAETDYKAINKVPIFNANLPVGHYATYAQDNGGEFARVGIGWLRWQLQGEKGPDGGGMFLGADCGLCKGTMWTVKKKNLD